MVKYYIENELTVDVQQRPRFSTLTEEEHARLYVEVKNATLQGLEAKLLSMTDKVDNKVNSLLLWVLEITDVKPMTPQVVKSFGSYPDYDIDISKERRDEVIQYTKDKYGSDKVTQIVTFGTLGAKAAIRSSARAQGFTVAEGDFLAKQIPMQPDITIQDSINASKILQEVIAKKQEPYLAILNVAQQLEGLPNSSGVHASAVCITDKPLYEYFPLMISKKENAAVLSQFEYYDVEALLCTKFDYLGLKTLDVIDKTIKLIKERHGIDIALDDIDVNDPSIYKLLNDGFNPLIFQFESDMFLSALKQVKPQNIHEISDITSLCRPGPLANGLLDQYVLAKLGGQKYTYGLEDEALKEKIWDICSTSYGLMVYQEQTIFCFSEIAGFNEIESDNARRAIGKKKREEMDALREKFVAGGVVNGYTSEGLNILFDQIARYAEYSFNLSHSICYSFITCHTAWLSANYPLEFFTAGLSIDAGNTDDVRRYIKAVKDRGYSVDPPDINSSDVGFKINGQSITFGLSGIKGVGSSVSNKILRRRGKRGYKSFGDFVVKNIDIINKKILEAYIKAGVFKSFGINKASLLDSIEPILEFNTIHKNISENISIFDIAKIKIPEYIDKCLLTYNPRVDELGYEIETLGTYITKHPMEDWMVNDRYKGARSVKDILASEEAEDGFIATAGCICLITIRKTKAKTNMASFSLTTPTEDIKCFVFPKVFPTVTEYLQEGKIVGIKGFVKEEEGIKSIFVNSFLDDHELSRLTCKIDRREEVVESLRYFRDIDGINADQYEKFGIIINDNLTYILSRGNNG